MKSNAVLQPTISLHIRTGNSRSLLVVTAAMYWKQPWIGSITDRVSLQRQDTHDILLIHLPFSFYWLPASLQKHRIFPYIKKWFTQSGDSMPYRLALPENYDPAKKYPWSFFCTGQASGEWQWSPTRTRRKIFAASSFRHQYQTIVLFPQCSEDGYWSNVETPEDAKALLERYIFKMEATPHAICSLLMMACKTHPSVSPRDPKGLMLAVIYGRHGHLWTGQPDARCIRESFSHLRRCGAGLANRLGHFLSVLSWLERWCCIPYIQ